MKRRKVYRKIWDKVAGKVRSPHRVLAEKMLARPLAPSEIVHHHDGDSANDDPANLLVLPSQRYHAHIEYHLRCTRRGMPSLFRRITEDRRGTLSEAVLP